MAEISDRVRLKIKQARGMFSAESTGKKFNLSASEVLKIWDESRQTALAKMNKVRNG